MEVKKPVVYLEFVQLQLLGSIELKWGVPSISSWKVSVIVCSTWGILFVSVENGAKSARILRTSWEKIWKFRTDPVTVYNLGFCHHKLLSYLGNLTRTFQGE